MANGHLLGAFLPQRPTTYHSNIHTHMKPFINTTFFLLFTAFLGQLCAQSIEFAPEGSVWKYQRQKGGWGPPIIDTVEVRYTDDIWVDTILCKRLTAPEGDYYVYQVGDRVYHRRDTASQFKLLWDFGVMPGDSFSVFNSTFASGNEVLFVCTGRDTIFENNVLLPRIDLTMYCGGSWVQSFSVNPRYGPRYNGYCPDYLFNTYNYCIVDAGYGFTLLSYSDSTFATVVNCPVSTIDPGALQHIGAAPNPTSGWVQLINLPDNTTTVHCYDTFGRRVPVPSGSGNTFDFSGRPNGIYLLDLQKDGQPFKRLRILKI
jgi:hypothetical protein